MTPHASLCVCVCVRQGGESGLTGCCWLHRGTPAATNTLLAPTPLPPPNAYTCATACVLDALRPVRPADLPDCQPAHVPCLRGLTPLLLTTPLATHTARAQDVDWEGHPATAILTQGKGAFLVARRGLLLSEYGTVDVRKAKQMVLDGEHAHQGGGKGGGGAAWHARAPSASPGMPCRALHTTPKHHSQPAHSR